MVKPIFISRNYFRISQRFFGIGLVLFFACSASRFQKVDTYVRQQNWQKAKATLEDAIQTNPRDGEAYLLLAEVNGELELIPAMMAALRKAEAISPRFKDESKYISQKFWIENFKHGNTFFQAQLYTEATMKFEACVQIDSTNVLSQQRYADALFNTRRYREAASAYQFVLAHSPGTLAVLNNLAEIYFIEKKYKKAIRICDEILLYDENDLNAVKRRAYSYDALNDFRKAEEDYLVLAMVQPSAQLLMDFGMLYFRNEDYKNAIARFKEALEFAPDNAIIFRRLGEANWRLRHYHEMALWYRKVVDSNPDDLTAWKNLALAYEALGQSEYLAQARYNINKITSTN